MVHCTIYSIRNTLHAIRGRFGSILMKKIYFSAKLSIDNEQKVADNTNIMCCVLFVLLRKGCNGQRGKAENLAKRQHFWLL